MPVRIPLDVDLEDKLLYGLTPARLAYLVVSLLASFSVWSTQWAATPLRAGVAIVLAVIGVSAAWGRWRARPADRWLADAVVFFLATYRVRWSLPRVISRRFRR